VVLDKIKILNQAASPKLAFGGFASFGLFYDCGTEGLIKVEGGQKNFRRRWRIYKQIPNKAPDLI
jgi:hypothetical protein